MSEQFTVVVRREGRNPLELTPESASVQFSTLAVGGFGSCSFTIPLRKGRAARDVPHLSHVLLYHGSQLLWEGRVEDHEVDVVRERLTLNCFGFHRLLEDTSVRRIWSLRSIGWQLVNTLSGSSGRSFAPQVWAWSTTGRFDETDLTKTGLKISAQTNQAASTGQAHGAWLYMEAAMRAIYFTARKVGNDPISFDIWDSADGSTWTQRSNQTFSTTATNYDVTTIPTTAKYLRFVVYFNSNVTGANVAGEAYNFRILGFQTTEDVTGGFYPRTLLTDLIGQVPGLRLGIIDNDTSYAIDALSRVSRDRARSVLDEITSYYRRRWGVWEDQTFEWRDINYDEPQWVLELPKLAALNLTVSVDNLHKTVYITYGHVATGLPFESTSTSTDQRNPYVRSGYTKDEVLSSPVGLTSASSAQLASRIAADHGSIPAVRGRVALPAFTPVSNLVGNARPACYIRAGENVVVPDLPKDDYLRPGRDGQTIFHVTSSTTDMEKGMTTLEVDGYTRSTDILMARVASGTRTLTG